MNPANQRTPNSRGVGEVVEHPFIRVVYQNGFPQDVGVNGCRVEDVIDVAIERLQQFQAGPLACEENRSAIRYLSAARQALHERIQRRQLQGVLNTYIKHENARTEDEEHDFSATGA